MPRRFASLAEASAAFQSGRSTECAAALSGATDAEQQLLLIRALVRIGQAQQAAQIASENQGAWRQLESDALRARLMLSASTAWHSSGDQLRADAALVEAIGYGICTDDDLVTGEIALRRAMLAWNDKKPLTACSFLSVATNAKEAGIRARARELLGLIAASEGQFANQVMYLEAAWHEIEINVAQDQVVAASILMNLSIAAVEMNRSEITECLTERFDQIDWNADLGYRHYMVLQQIAWAQALSGNHIAAFSLLRRAGAVASSKAWQLQAFIARSFLAREMGEKLFAQAEYEQCMLLANEIEWNATRGEERTVLLEFAKLVACVDSVEARRILDTIYGCITSSIDVNFVPASDQRRVAFELQANGIVSYHEGKVADCGRYLTAAFDIWVRCGYVWRATEAAVYLSEISDDPRFLNYLLENGPKFPNSWLAARANEAAKKGPQVQPMDGVRCIAV